MSDDRLLFAALQTVPSLLPEISKPPAIKPCPWEVNNVYNNIRTLKFKAKLTVTFYAAVNHYRNGHPKPETSKMDRNPPIMNQESNLLTSLKYCTCFLRGP